MDDAVARYCAATESDDMEAMAATLAPDVRLASPLSGRLTFKGRDDVRFLLTAVYGLLRGVHWDPPIGDGPTRVAITAATVGGLRIDDAMVFELDQDGLIRRIRPHLRPWLALSVFALLVGPRVASRPAVLLRALRG